MKNGEKNETKVLLIINSFGSVKDAVREINIMLKKTGYPKIMITDFVERKKYKKGKDWFQEYIYIFQTVLPGDLKEIEKNLSGTRIKIKQT